MQDSSNIPTKLLWIDLEMTGLNPQTDRILEVAAIVTDFTFAELARYESVIYQPPEVMATMNEWCVATHTASGLVDRVQVGYNEQHVVTEFMQFISENFLNQTVYLAGNSIHQDRQFIRHWWPNVEVMLHYRMLDVSSFKLLWLGQGKVPYVKKETHRALSDIEESIAELKFYLDS